MSQAAAPARLSLAQTRGRACEAHQAGRHDEARDLYAAYLAQVPQDAGIWSNLGVLLRATGRHELARVALERAHALEPAAPGIRGNLANVLADLGQSEAALRLRRGLVEEAPDDFATIAMIGKVLRTLGRHDEAVEILTDGAARFPEYPEMRIQLALAQLSAGDYRRGFRSYETRWETGELGARELAKPRWRGEWLGGKRILVVPEQGFGDSVAFARFLPELRRFDPAEVLMLTEKPVARLLSATPGADWSGTSAGPDRPYDTWVPMMDLLPHHFERTDAIPPPSRLHVPEDSRQRARAITAPARGLYRVGLNWGGSTTYRGDAFRSFGHRELWPLLDLPRTRFYGLYKGPRTGEFQSDGTAALIQDVARTDRDFADSAATMLELDLVITTCTAIAHVAGSLGVPVWVLLHWDNFWLWGKAGETTPWYPAMTLIRQERPRDWAGVVARVRDRLSAELARREAMGHG